QSELNLSNLQLGLLGTVFLWVYGALSPFSGYVADRINRRKIIVFSLAVWSTVTWATAHARNFTELICARGLMGISEACYLPAALALIADHHTRTRSRAVGIHQSGTYVGFILGGVGGGWIGQRYGWRAIFTILGIFGVAYAIFLVFGLGRSQPREEERREPEKTSFGAALKELLGIRNFVTLCSLNAIGSVAWWIVYTWLPLHLYERFHMSLATAGFTATFYLQMTGLVGILCGGWIADRWSLTSDRGRLLTQVIGILVAGPMLSLIGYT